MILAAIVVVTLLMLTGVFWGSGSFSGITGSGPAAEQAADLVGWYTLERLPVGLDETQRFAIPPAADEVFLVGVFRIDSTLLAATTSGNWTKTAQLSDFLAELPDDQRLLAKGSQRSVWNSPETLLEDAHAPFFPGELALVPAHGGDSTGEPTHPTIVTAFWTCPRKLIEQRRVRLQFRDAAPDLLTTDKRIDAKVKNFDLSSAEAKR